MTTPIPIVTKTPLDPFRLLHFLEAVRGQVRRAKKLADRLGSTPEEVAVTALKLVAAGYPIAVRALRSDQRVRSFTGMPWPHGFEYGQVSMLFADSGDPLKEFYGLICDKIREVEDARLRRSRHRLSSSSPEIANALDEHLVHYTDLRLGIEMALGLITPPSP